MKLFSKVKSQERAVDIAQTVQDAQDEVSRVAPDSVAPVKTKVPLTHRTVAKVMAFMLVIIMVIIAIGSVLGAIFMIEEELYTVPEWTYKENAMRNLAEGDVITLIEYLEEGEKRAKQHVFERNIASVEMSFSDGPRNKWSYSSGNR